MPNLPEIGVYAVVENLPAFNRAITQMNRTVDATSKTIQQAAANSANMTGAAGALGNVLGGVLTAGAVAAGLAIAAAGTAIGTFIALAKRGSEIDDIAKSFNILESSLGGNVEELKKLREGAAGTISDIELMRIANQALIGTTGAFAAKFATTLPKLLEIARVQANATGQSVSEVYNAIINGVKQAQPRMLNHVGIIVKTTFANEAFAKSIGKDVADLSLEEQQMAALNAVMSAGGDVLAKYGGLAESADEKMGRLGATATNAINSLALATQPAFKRILDALQPIFDFLAKFASAAAPYIAALANLFASLVEKILGPIGKALKGLNAETVAKNFFTGGARIMGALAAGIAQGATLVIQVVTTIAKTIANFLIGFSPPPEGPLSTIDTGGANVLKAWLQGFLGVSLDPVEQVAGQVNDLMGNAATATADQVAGRLSVLDQALQPFQDRLALVRAEFDALKAPVDAAFSSIDRQMEKALAALNRGDQGSAAMVRQLDNQRQALQDYVDAQQAQVDTAQVQLSLAEAQQAQERAALAIRQKVVGTPTETAIPAAPGLLLPTGTEGIPGATAGALAATATSPADVVSGITGIGGSLDTFSGDVAKAMKAMKDAFNEGFTGAGGSMGKLKDAIAELAITWDGLKEKASKVGPWISGVWETVKTNLSAAWEIIKTNAETWWNDTRKSIEDAWTGLQINIGLAILNIRNNIETSWSSIQTWLTTTIGNIQTGIEKAWTDIRTGVETAWSNIQTWLTTTIGNIQNIFTTAWANITGAIGLALLLARLAIENVWNGIVNFVGGLVGRIRGAFDSITSAIRNALQPAIDFINRITDFRPPSWAGGGGSRGFGFATGGDFPAHTLMTVGERGPELVSFGQSGHVFSNQVSNLLSSVASGMFAQPMPSYAYGGNSAYNTYNQQQSMGDINFQGVQGTDDAMRRYALLKALGRVR